MVIEVVVLKKKFGQNLMHYTTLILLFEYAFHLSNCFLCNLGATGFLRGK